MVQKEQLRGRSFFTVLHPIRAGAHQPHSSFPQRQALAKEWGPEGISVRQHERTGPTTPRPRAARRQATGPKVLQRVAVLVALLTAWTMGPLFLTVDLGQPAFAKGGKGGGGGGKVGGGGGKGANRSAGPAHESGGGSANALDAEETDVSDPLKHQGLSKKITRSLQVYLSNPALFSQQPPDGGTRKLVTYRNAALKTQADVAALSFARSRHSSASSIAAAQAQLAADQAAEDAALIALNGGKRLSQRGTAFLREQLGF